MAQPRTVVESADLVEVACSNCSRTFRIKDNRAAAVRSARCVCGERLNLVPGGGDGASSKLGKYVLIKRIAVGGMGEIFYGKIAGVEGFEREVAIKRMLPHLSADQNFIDMLINEAKLTVLLNHPNIVQVYDLAKEGDEYYIAMEYVPAINVGGLLERCIRQRIKTPLELAVHIVLQVLKGLGYAHDLKGPSGVEMHVLHRDITPQNILITRQAWVKITDFGIAKAMNEISTTNPGMIKGKLGYIAPEQLQGKAPDGRGDIFCSGILLWEILATRRLFKGTDEVDTFRLIVDAQVPSISEIREDVPRAVETALLGALTPNRDDRYATCEEFYEALSKAMAPQTADDCHNRAREFLGEHDDFFAELADSNTDEQDMANNPTVALPVDGELTEITDLVKREKRPRGLPRSAVVALLLLSVGAALLGRYGEELRPYLDRLKAEQPPALTQAQVQLAVDGERARVIDCYKVGTSKLSKLDSLAAVLTIPSTGGVARVGFRPKPDKWGTAEICLRGLFRQLRFAPHRDPELEARATLPAPREVLKRVAGASKHKGRKQPPPKQDERQIVGQTLKRYRAPAKMGTCIARHNEATAPPKVMMEVSVLAGGRVKSIGFEPDLPDAGVRRCLKELFSGITFRGVSKQFEFKIPLTLKTVDSKSR